MKIGFTTRDMTPAFRNEHGNPTFGGSGHYRIDVPAHALARWSDHEIVVGTLATLADGTLCIREWAPDEPIIPELHPTLTQFGLGTAPIELTGPLHHDCDMIVLHRYMDVEIPGMIRRARALGQIVVNDIDDWFFGLDTRNQAHRETNPRRNPEVNRVHYAQALRASDAITCSTHWLADALSTGAGIETPAYVLENALDIERWELNERDDDPFTVGWIGTTSYRSGDLETLRGMIGPWCTDNGARWFQGGHRIGTDAAFLLAGIDPEKVECIFAPMMPISHYPVLFRMLDIGLVPLNDVPFNRGKSAIKGLEYAAAGVPFVAAASPAYERLSRLSGVGLLAHDRAEWRAHLDALTDPVYRGILADANRAIVEAMWSIDVRWKDWAEAYASIRPLS
jgi:hypothetical protein